MKITLLKLPLFSLLLIAVCVFIPLFTLSLTNGFQLFSIDKLEKFYFPYWVNFHSLQLQNELIPPSYSSQILPFYQDYTMLESPYNKKKFPSLIRAFSTSDFKNNTYLNSYKLIQGKKVPKKGEIVLSENLAYNLRANLESNLNIIALKPKSFSPIYQSTLVVKGIISFGSSHLDKEISFINNESLGDVFALNSSIINTVAFTHKKHLSFLLKNPSLDYSLQSLKEMPYLKNLRTQKFFLQIILITISFICFFSVFISINVSILKNLKPLALFKILGLKHNDIFAIFVLQGFILAIGGTLLGLSLSTLIIPHSKEILVFIENIVNAYIDLIRSIHPSFISRYYRFMIIPENIFYVSSPPIHFILSDFITQSVVIIISVLSASIIPSIKLKNSPLIESIKINTES